MTSSPRPGAPTNIGVRQVWLAQQFDHDAIALAGLIGAAVPGLGVGTSVVPINPRHPLIVASLAQTAQAAAHGNFSLGLGPGRPRAGAVSVWRPVAQHDCGACATPDRAAVGLRHRIRRLHWSEISASPEWPVKVAGAHPIPVYVAAMGPKRCRSPANSPTAPCHSLPVRARSPSSSNRPSRRRPPTLDGRSPDHRCGARAGVRRCRCRARPRRSAVGFYETIPSYQKVIAREGVDSAADLAAVGSLESVARQLQGYLDAGATDVVLSPLRTERALLGALGRRPQHRRNIGRLGWGSSTASRRIASSNVSSRLQNAKRTR